MNLIVEFRMERIIKAHTIQLNYDDVDITIDFYNSKCTISLAGKQVVEPFYFTWELLSIIDGHFYEPIKLNPSGVSLSMDDLYRLSFYYTDEKLAQAARSLDKYHNGLNSNTLSQYASFKMQGMSQSKLTDCVIHSYFYLQSRDYAGININHRLSLLLNTCDGLVINVIKNMRNIEKSLDMFFADTIDWNRVQYALQLMNYGGSLNRAGLGEERNMFGHYAFKRDSFSSFIFHSSNSNASILYYFIYILNLTFRVKLLKLLGYSIDSSEVDAIVDEINDWYIFENGLSVPCSTEAYKLKQMMQSAQY